MPKVRDSALGRITLPAIAASAVVTGVVVSALSLTSTAVPAFAGGPTDLSITSYGATPNDGTDDSTAIQRAIDAAQTAGGGVVWVPAGTYRVGTTIAITGNNVTLEGSGAGSVLHQTGANGTVIKVGGTGTASATLEGTQHNAVKNLTVDRSVAQGATSIGLWVDRAKYTDVEGLYVYNSAYGIAVGPDSDAADIPNQFTNIRNTVLEAQGSLAGGATPFSQAGIMFWSGADHKVSEVFIEPSNRGLVMDNNSNGISIDQLSVINGGPFNYGVVSMGTGFARTIENSILENARQGEIYVAESSNRITITDNWIGAGDALPEAVNRVGVQVDPGASRVTIANNRIGDQRNSGIVSRGDDIIITGNRLDGNVNAGGAKDHILIEGGQHINVTNNIIASGLGRCGIGVYNFGSDVVNYVVVTGNDSVNAPGASLCRGSGVGTNIVNTGNFH